MAALLTTALTFAWPEVAQLPPRPGLSDPLVMFDGTKVTTAKQWAEARRPELRSLFEHYMYGPLPSKPTKVTAKVERTDPKALGGAATLKEITLSVGPEGSAPLHLLLVVPNARGKPFPVFAGLSFDSLHTLLDDPAVRISTAWQYAKRPGVVDNRATEAGRGQQKDVWNLRQSVERGYAVAVVYNGDIDPDRADERGGVRPLLPKETGTVMAWAWGLHRVVDYLTTDPDIDPKRIAAVGHSRLGKATLVAAAFDDRIALAIPHQAGCGGTAPSRGTVGESVERINTAFPHWFNARFKEFNKQPERLPFDQHCLAALVAPRPLLFSNAVEDTWANPYGQFDVLKAADPVYRLLGVEGLEADRPPTAGRMVESRVGYYLRPGKHAMMTGDWQAFLDFADKHMK